MVTSCSNPNLYSNWIRNHQFRIIEPATFGLLNKNVSFTIHDNLLIPFVVLLVLHVTLKPIKQLYRKHSRKE
jgi:hypothetical protein